jgi:uncharacterized protein (TIGR02284 family)
MPAVLPLSSSSGSSAVTETPAAPGTDAYVVQWLNTLIETTLDSAENFEKAAGLARNPRFQGLFKDRAHGRQKLAETLQAEVRGFGAEPWDKGSFRGLAQRTFLELRDKVGGKSDKPVIEAMEREDDFIANQFAEAAHDEQLPEQARQAVERAQETLQAEHDEIRAIRDEFD